MFQYHEVLRKIILRFKDWASVLHIIYSGTFYSGNYCRYSCRFSDNT